ncbi:ABC transporter [Corynebacterium frankenforstense DSM 45800]|uniref:ABC transporter n=1 Tax=Corynebacterium frankenforstense DSM 45800 TaxID=1437875 RepID=A0A1L7CRX9_9CORY|nr:energy-coupling factor transporter transmembrane component T [Corynebacterium frankenforstense]APT88614.1 ABC transporter [Corynebacterium frankenforstense DSM 45800]
MNLISKTNPVTRVAGLALMTTPLLISVDWLSAAVALVLTVALAPLCGVGPLTLAKRGWPILAVAPVAGVSMALFGRPQGHEYFSFLVAHVTDNSLELALAVTLRVCAVALPVVVLVAHIDPTDLGDGLAQIAHLPERFVIAAIAGARLITLFRDDWVSMSRARRARGIADRGRLRHLATLSFGLLVIGLRRGSKLAVAMEARGFGRAGRRTWARTSTVSLADAALLAVCVIVPALALGAAMSAGTFRFLGA